jgi:hypothetical protein
MSPSTELQLISSFVPVVEESQRFMGSLVDLPIISAHKNVPQAKPLGSPSKLYRVQGDGNCLFRSLSYAIGNTTYEQYRTYYDTSHEWFSKRVFRSYKNVLSGNMRIRY